VTLSRTLQRRNGEVISETEGPRDGFGARIAEWSQEAMKNGERRMKNEEKIRATNVRSSARRFLHSPFSIPHSSFRFFFATNGGLR